MIIRALDATDTDAVSLLHERANHTDPGLGPVPPDQWRRFIAQPANHNGRLFRIAECAGEMVGVAIVSLKQQPGGTVPLVRIVVDPAVRRRGIGSALLASILADATGSLGGQLQALVRDSWKAGLAFATHAGFAQIESELTMLATDLMAPPAPIDKIMFECLDESPRGASAVADIHNAAFERDIAFSRLEPHVVAAGLSAGDAIMVAISGATVVGYCRLELESDRVWLDEIAIDPALQGRGIGPALAFHALTRYRDASRPSAGLNVSSANPNALKVYRALGFKEVRRTHRLTARREAARDLLRQSVAGAHLM